MMPESAGSKAEWSGVEWWMLRALRWMDSDYQTYVSRFCESNYLILKERSSAGRSALRTNERTSGRAAFKGIERKSSKFLKLDCEKGEGEVGEWGTSERTNER